MANRLRGSYRDIPKNGRIRGVARSVRHEKMMEACDRDELTPHERTRRHHLRRCHCYGGKVTDV